MNTFGKSRFTKTHCARRQQLIVLLIVLLGSAPALAQAWVSLPDMRSRHRHVAAGSHLANGDGRVFVFGGLVYGPANKAVDAFNPIDVKWETPGTYPDMPVNRMLASIATGSSGKIYIIGGIGPGNTNLASVDVFDPNGPWSTISNMPTPRNSAGATFGPDGKLYVIGGLSASGGQQYDVVERYDPNSMMWETLAPLPMPLPGNGGSAVGAAVGCDGSIIVISNSWPGGGNCTAHTFAYDIGNNHWQTRAGMPGCLGGRGVVRGPNGLIYAVNDGNYFASAPGDTRVYAYDSASDSWAAVSDTLVGHQELAVAALGDRIYALGGISKFGPKTGSRFESLVTGVTSVCRVWEHIPGTAQDVGAGDDGTTWKIGTIPAAGGFDIARWDGSSWVGITGGAVRIDVDPQGNPWVVNSYGNIYKYTQSSSSWQQISGKATDLGISRNGTVWKIGTTPVTGGFDIAKWDGNSWIGITGGAVRIDVDSQGDPWVVNSYGNIYKYSQASITWKSLPGHATDLGIGGNDTVWKTGAPPGNTYGFKISKWNGTGWDTPVQGAAEEISVGPDGTPWVVNLRNALYHRH